MDILRRVGNRIRALRKQLGLSIEELADRADIHPSYLGGVERGERNLTLKNLNKIARGLGVDTSDLLLSLPLKGREREEAVVREVMDLLRNKDRRILELARRLVNEIVEWQKRRSVAGQRRGEV